MSDKTFPVVLVTGASSGIGQAVAILFSERGWRVAATMRNPSDGTELASRDGIMVLPLDVTHPASINAAVEAAVERFGRIDVVINNAGYGLGVPRSLNQLL